MDERSQYKTALGLAKRALDYIARYGTPPTPHSYELFYTVCAGLNPPLNEALAQLIADTRRVSAADAERLHQKFLSKEPPSETMESIGAHMSGEMKSLLSILGTAAASTQNYQASLHNAEEQLNNPSAEKNISLLVQSLLNTTQTMARTNAEVTANLETSRAQVEQLEECLKVAREESSRDSLTGLVNKRQFELLLDEALQDASSSGAPVSLLLLDIDNFHEFNERFGHVAGDSALRFVASCINSNIKGRDTAGRFGGEEFAVLLPNTSIEHALSLAERIRHLVNARHLIKKATGENMGRISVSVGACERIEGEVAQAIVNRTEQCLLAAKQGGRNQVSSAGETPPPLPQDAISGAA